MESVADSPAGPRARLKQYIAMLPELSRAELVDSLLAEGIAKPPDSTPDEALRRVLKAHFVGKLRQVIMVEKGYAPAIK